MKNKIAQTIASGLVATSVMTVVGLVAPYLSLPKMNPAEMLSGMMGVPLLLGFLLHCMIGVVFAAAYVYLFNPKVHIQNRLLKGALFGLVVFVFAQVMMFIIGKIMPMPTMDGNMMLMMIGSLVGHLVYGFVVALIVPLHYVKRHRDTVRTAHA